ncbi:MAG: diaminopimelate epimerase [Gammaproteobacteria bacterium]|jgi:diaminopimelate epimerase|nr:diaminopimelate epimerase [Gammaproteobacteria bacterium]
MPPRQERLRFTKMHGLGNDFVVIDAIRQSVPVDPDKLRHIADRHFGVGCDQILMVEPARHPGLDFRYRIFNADGGEVEQCGNGARCFARYVIDQGLTQSHILNVETAAGDIQLRIEDDGRVTVDMGRPRLDPAQIPFVAPKQAKVYPLSIGDEALEISAVSMGNPHAVVVVEDLDRAPVARWGPMIEHHTRFPARVNAGFLQILRRDLVRLRVYERGAGETLACGTGACAAVVAGRIRGLLDARVEVSLPGGSLSIVWEDERSPVMMTGPATIVFEGVIAL